MNQHSMTTPVDQVSTLQADLEALNVTRGFLFGALFSLPFWVGLLGVVVVVKGLLP